MNKSQENHVVEGVMKRQGIVDPVATRKNAERTGLSLGLACSFLVQETGGGNNVFGHDPVRSPQVVGGVVTKDTYLHYRDLRKRGYGMQGVGPMQLTWYSYQDQADGLGGCWKPEVSMYVGFSLVMSQIKSHGKRAGIAAYNGSGPAAIAYSASVRTRAAWFSLKFKRAIRRYKRHERKSVKKHKKEVASKP